MDPDGQSNANEYVVNTVLANKDSLFQFTNDQATSAVTRVDLSLHPTFTSRNDQIQHKLKLSNTAWNVLVPFVYNTNVLTRVFRDTNAPSDGTFYRARIDVAFRPDAPICI
jgi:hypothetical protein